MSAWSGVQTLPACKVCGRERPVCRDCGRCGDSTCNAGCIFCIQDNRPLWRRFLPGRIPQENRMVPR